MRTWGSWTTGTAAVALILAVGACTPVDPPPTTVPADIVCRADRDTLETAIEAWTVSEGAGRYPDTLEEVAALFLEPDFPLDVWTYTRTVDSYLLTGPC